MTTPNFDPVVPFYDLLARLVFRNAIKKSQLALLDQIKEGDNVLIIGGGTGWIVKALLQVIQPSRIVYVEASAKMLQAAKTKVNSDRVQWIHGTQEDIPIGEFFDVVFTAYFLDVFDDVTLQKVVPQLIGHLNPNGKWLFADFVRSNWLVKLAYYFFNLTTCLKTKKIPDYDFALQQLSCQREQFFLKKKIASRVYLNN